MLSSRKQLNDLSFASDKLYAPTERENARMKELLLMIYKDVFAVCEENNLTLFLGGGSALGQVRHGGFIPWDDDMDLMMIREDYEAFKKIELKNLDFDDNCKLNDTNRTKMELL